MTAIRYFQIRITDRDGEVQEYNVSGRSLFYCLSRIHQMMLVGDFYGHKETDTIEVLADEYAEGFRPEGHVVPL